MIAIISDIHGNFPALQAVLNDIDSLGCEKIISLGDVAGYYCLINECIDELRSRNIINIMGNHDDYIVSNTNCPRSNSANECLAFQQQVITEDNRHWLKNSKPSLFFDDISMVHAGWKDNLDEYISTISEQYFKLLPGRYFFSGHTHVQILASFTDKIYCNPGSVGQPRDGNWRAAYAIFANGKISLRRVIYDIKPLAQAMQEAEFSPYFYENLYHGTQIGGKITTISRAGID